MYLSCGSKQVRRGFFTVFSEKMDPSARPWPQIRLRTLPR